MVANEAKSIITFQARSKILHSETLENNNSASSKGEIFQRWNKNVIAHVYKMKMNLRAIFVEVHHC
jgi:hypothetical protein